MTHFSVFVGIDVSKDRLDVHCLTEGETQGIDFALDNTAQGYRALQRRLGQLAEPAQLGIALEASGGYERGVLMALLADGFIVYRLDAGQTRSFARAERQLAKTDRLDAALIARALRALEPRLQPCRPDPLIHRLVSHLRVRQAHVEQIGRWRNTLQQLDEPSLQRRIRRQIEQAQRAILVLEKDMLALLRTDPAKAELYRRLLAVPGVGPVTALFLIARLPELGRLSSRAVAALVGLAPYDHQSGNTAAPRHCAGGRPDLRRVLYMAALAITRSGNPSALKSLYNRLLAAGKPFKIAIVALMRKLLVAINAMVASNQSWNPT